MAKWNNNNTHKALQKAKALTQQSVQADLHRQNRSAIQISTHLPPTGNIISTNNSQIKISTLHSGEAFAKQDCRLKRGMEDATLP